MTDIEELRKECFNKLKPIVDSLSALLPQMTRAKSKSASVILNDLFVNLEAIQDPEAIMNQANTQTVIIPLLNVFKSMTIEERYGYEIVIEPWLKVMHFLLLKTLVKTWMQSQFTIQLIILFSNFIEQPQSIKKTTQSSEEVKYLAVQCLSVALPAKYKEGRYDSFKESIYYSLVQSMRTDSFIPIASPLVMALLNTIKEDQNIQLRLESLQVLSQLLHDNIHNVDSLSLLFPGITSKLCTVISQKAEKENHQVMCSALNTLGELIQVVMCDELNNTLVDIDSFQDIVTRHQDEKKPENNDSNNRDKAWFSKSKESLFNVMGQILKIRLYPDWRTRLAFVEFAFTVLSTCARALDNCIKPLVEIMVLHTDDTYPEVSNTCRLRMQFLLSTPAFEDSIIPILKDELYEWIMNFPQYAISRDETEKTNAMSLITGFILLLGDQSESVLATVLSRASDGWMTALEIDKDSLNILEEMQSERFIELKSDDTRSTPIYPKIRFKHVVTDITTAKLTRVLNVIGKYCDLQSWIYHFMRYISLDNHESNDPQAAYIVHSLLSGAFALDVDTTNEVDGWINGDDDTMNDSGNMKLKMITLQLLKDTMAILTSAASTNGKTSALTTTTISFRLDEESGYILTVCFGLQIVGLTACILEKDYLQDQLITMLYPLLAHLGSSNVYIHTYALITLDAIALVCGLNNAQELAIQNIDYIINMISQHIAVLSDNARVPLVLKALIHVGGYASIGYLDDSVLEIYDALDRYYLDDWLCMQLCSVLFEIVQTLEKNIPKITTVTPEESTASNNETKGDEMSKEIKSFIQDKEDVYGQEAKEFKSMEEIGKYFLDRQEQGKHEDLTLQQVMEQGNLPMDLPKEDDGGEENLPKDEEDIPLDREEIMAKEIMDKASHFLTASSPQLRSQMLILLTSGVSILANNPKELNQLLHGMWTSIVNRFNDPQNYVVLHAANLIEKVSEVSTDYLSRKFDKDLWPRIKSLLRKGTTAASANTISDYSVFSLYHRTQLCLLKTLTHIAYHVPMNQPKIKEILEETKYYYHNDQVHEQLANGCEELFKALSTQQPDTVWFYQVSLHQEEYTKFSTPPSSLLDPLVIPEWMKPQYNSTSNTKPRAIMI